MVPGGLFILARRDLTQGVRQYSQFSSIPGEEQGRSLLDVLFEFDAPGWTMNDHMSQSHGPGNPCVMDGDTCGSVVRAWVITCY